VIFQPSTIEFKKIRRRGYSVKEKKEYSYHLLSFVKKHGNVDTTRRKRVVRKFSSEKNSGGVRKNWPKGLRIRGAF